MDGILGLLLFIAFMTLITACIAAVLLLVQAMLVALSLGVGCLFSTYFRENHGQFRNFLKTAIKYRLCAIPGVIVFDLLAFTLLADSLLVTTWIEDEWLGWLGLGLFLMASVGLAFLVSFWGKTKQLAEPHNRVLVMEAILSCYLCWLGAKNLIFD